MALRFILGPSGSGKSRLLFDTVLKRAQERPDGRFIVLVPEQFTLQTQRDLVELSDCGGILNIDVLSFTRLAWRVFEQTGVERRSVLSETGKSLMLRLIAARETPDLQLLSGILDKPGVISEIKSVLSELDQYGITPDMLRELENGLGKDAPHRRLAHKLEEIRILQEAFEKYQADHFITAEKLPRILCSKAPLDPTLRGAEFYLDGYTGFTPAQLDVIAALLPVAGDITVTVTIDPGERELLADDPVAELASCRPGGYELFALSKKTLSSLIEVAGNCGALVEAPVILDGSAGRMKRGSELAWLESHLFRTGRRGREPYPAGKEQEQPQILLRSCADPYDEVVSAAVTIKELTLSGMRYRDIAVVCGSLKDYAEYTKRVLSSYEIPYFIDRTSPVVLNPAFEFVESSIDILEKNYSYESIMRLIRTGLILDPESGEADLLENYLLAAGIRGRKAWAEPFTRQTKSGDESLLAAAECARIAFSQRFLPFAEIMKKGKAPLKDRAAALWQFLLDCGVPEKLDRFAEECRESGRADRADEYGQIIRVIKEVLEEASDLIGGEAVTRRQFMDILRAGFSEAQIGIIPPGIDEVHVGDLQRTRLEHIRAVIFLGLNDGNVPERKSGGGVLNDMEREYLREKNVRLAPTAREDANIQQFYLYLTLTKPSGLLVMSWSESKRDGSELRPAPVVNAVRKLFPGRELLPPSSKDPYYAVTSGKTGLGVLAEGVSSCLHSDDETAREREKKLKELLKIYQGAEGEWDETVSSILRAAADAGQPVQINEETAALLYGSILHGSITRLEKYVKCPFMHFAQFGLKLEEREEYTVGNPDIGNLLHRALELFSVKIRRNTEGYSWNTIPDEIRDSWAKEALEEAAGTRGGQLFWDTQRSRNILERCGRILLRSVRTIQTQVRSGLFVPAGFEVPFRSDDELTAIGDLPGGAKLQLRGRIDRIDECDDPQNGKLYFRIIDYKSSSSDLNLEQFVDGEQLQLVVYLDTAAQMEQRAHRDRSVVCAGMFYYNMQDPILSFEDAGEDIERAMLKATKMKGILNASPDVLQRLDRTLVPGSDSLVVPAGLKQDGGLKARSSVLSAEQIDELREYSRAKMHSLASEILKGGIAPAPLQRQPSDSACSGCCYRDVCHFSEMDRNMSCNRKDKRDEQELWNIIRQTIRSGNPDTEGAGGAEDGR